MSSFGADAPRLERDEQDQKPKRIAARIIRERKRLITNYLRIPSNSAFTAS